MKTTIDLPESIYQSVSEQARAAGSPIARWLEALVIRIVSEPAQRNAREEELADWRSELL